MPSCMVINTESTVGYNNQLKQAGPGMKLGVNNNVNTGTKKVGIQHMDGLLPKTNRPTSHPSNPIHKEAIAAQLSKNKPDIPVPREQALQDRTIPLMQAPQDTAHNMNKTWLMGGITLAVFAISAFWSLA